MADDSVVNAVTEETKQKLKEDNKLTPQEQQDAYFELVQIFSYAQATGDYARFQADLTEWKRRYPVDYFGEEYVLKIRYMLSEEFLENVLKGYLLFVELSKKDPAKGLDELRKVLKKAETHKDGKKLDKDLQALYKEYPLSFLKEKYPHYISQLLSKTYREKILEKFDSDKAFEELKKITENPQDYKDADSFKSALSVWKELYPVSDFNDKTRSDVEKTLAEFQDENKIAELFAPSIELDLTEGEIIPIKISSKSSTEQNALTDFLNITSRNAGDIDALFAWTCKYSKYINSFSSETKDCIVATLKTRYSNEMSTDTNYRIPSMESDPDKLLSEKEYDQIGDLKKASVLQLLGMLSVGQDLTHDDNTRLKIIDANAEKARIIKKAKIDKKLEVFTSVVEKHSDTILTPSDDIYLNTSPESEDKVKVQVVPKVDVSTPIGFARTSSSSSTSGNTGGGGVSAGLSLPSLDDDSKKEKPKKDTSDKENSEAEDHEESSEPQRNRFFVPITTKPETNIPEGSVFTIENSDNSVVSSDQGIEPSTQNNSDPNNPSQREKRASIEVDITGKQPDSRENSFKGFFVPYGPTNPDTDDFER